MLSLASYQEPRALGEGRAHGYMKKHREPGSAALDSKCFTAKENTEFVFRDNESSAAALCISAVKIGRMVVRKGAVV